MSVMGQTVCQALKPKKFRRLVYVSPVVSVLALVLLLWTYRLDWSVRPQIQQQPKGLHQHDPGQPVPPGEKVSFLEVNGTKTLLVSAYLEHRTSRREVRIIAVVLRSETAAYRCIFRCQEQLRISEGVSSIHWDHFGFAYGTADIMCPLPSGCGTPTHVTVTSAAVSFKDSLDNIFLEVRNREVKTASFPYNFTLCLSTMFDFSNVLQLVQSLEVVQLLGVNRVVVYKTSCSPEAQRLLDYYSNKGLVEVIPWTVSRFVNVSRGWQPEQSPGDLHYFGQIAALNDCLYRYMYQSRYVALQDIDELILPQSVNSWLELLPLLETKYGADRCYMFENNVFPNTVMLPPPTSQTPPSKGRCCPGWQNVSGVDILAHLHHEPIRDDTRYMNFKVIVNPRVVFVATVHGVLDSQRGCIWVDRDVARMYHTRSPWKTGLTPDQLIYDGRLLSYSADLTPAVNAALHETGILSDDRKTRQHAVSGN